MRNRPPTKEDFRSQRAEAPDRKFSVTECQARGLSVHTVRSDSEKVLKLPKFQGRFICRLRLGAGAGRMQQTGRPSHYTWWPFADYDVLACCDVEAP